MRQLPPYVLTYRRNRSDAIRQIFGQFGPALSTNAVHTKLAREGLTASDSLIRAQRKRLSPAGTNQRAARVPAKTIRFTTAKTRGIILPR